MNETPRTDALEASFKERATFATQSSALNLARTLERELAASRAECAKVREALEIMLDTFGGEDGISRTDWERALIAACAALQKDF